MRIAVIPARGGSKRIPRKNIRAFNGRPMIGWPIAAAITSGCFDRIIVSTDDAEIAQVAKAEGAEVPFVRPAELSDDYTGTTAVISHAVKWLRDQGVTATEVCCIYATAPFIKASDLQVGLETLLTTNADYAFSVTGYASPIQRALRITRDERIEMFYPEHLNTRSQNLEKAWHDAAQFYWGRAQSWFENKPIFSGSSIPIILPRHQVQDIDTPEDWITAEAMFRSSSL
jgi:pseudaminic acid cytidylyltransferase